MSDDSLGKWLLSRVRGLYAAALSLLTTANAVIQVVQATQVSWRLDSENAAVASHAIHLVVLALLLVHGLPEWAAPEVQDLETTGSFTPPAKGLDVSPVERRPTARWNAPEQAVAQFRRAFLRLLACWLGLYTILIVSRFAQTSSLFHQWSDWLANLANNVCTAALIGVWVCLNSYTIDSRPEEQENRQRHERLVTTVVLFVAFVTVAHALVLLESFRSWYTSVTGNLVFETDVVEVFAGIGGLLSAIALSLIVGRLDSKYIGAGGWAMVLLFGYAALQPAWVVFRSRPAVGAMLMSIAIPMKILLFSVVLWSVQTGRLGFYMARVRRLMANVDVEREAYLKGHVAE